MSIDNFLKDLTKHSPHLRQGGSLCAWKDAYRKIKCRLCEKDDLVRFRDEIGFHIQAVQMLMLTIQMHVKSLITITTSTNIPPYPDVLLHFMQTRSAINLLQ